MLSLDVFDLLRSQGLMGMVAPTLTHSLHRLGTGNWPEM